MLCWHENSQKVNKKDASKTWKGISLVYIFCQLSTIFLLAVVTPNDQILTVQSQQYLFKVTRTTNGSFVQFSLLFTLNRQLVYFKNTIPANIDLFKVNNTNTRKRCEMCKDSRIDFIEIVLVSSLLTFNSFHPLL